MLLVICLVTNLSGVTVLLVICLVTNLSGVTLTGRELVTAAGLLLAAQQDQLLYYSALLVSLVSLFYDLHFLLSRIKCSPALLYFYFLLLYDFPVNRINCLTKSALHLF